MVTVRSAKSKGSQFEYSCQYSLQQWTNKPVTRTSERGFQMQFDLKIGDEDGDYWAVECKRLKGISWNQLVKFYEKLDKVTPETKYKFILFQSNRQPCLIFYKNFGGSYNIQTFEDYFLTPFQKHPSTRVTKK